MSRISRTRLANLGGTLLTLGSAWSLCGIAPAYLSVLGVALDGVVLAVGLGLLVRWDGWPGGAGGWLALGRWAGALLVNVHVGVGVCTLVLATLAAKTVRSGARRRA
jgi:hypothetical protein